MIKNKSTLFCLLAVLLLISSFKVSGQDKKWAFGIQLAPGLSTIRGNDHNEKNYDAAFGLAGGLSAFRNLNEHWSVGMELLLERKAQKTETVITDYMGNEAGKATVFSRFDGLTLPLLVRYAVGKEKFHMYMNAGPQVFFLSKHGYHSSSDLLEELNMEDTENFNRTDFGICFGAGAAYDVSDHFQVTAEVRDFLGFANMSKLELVDGGKIQLNAIRLMLGVSFRI